MLCIRTWNSKCIPKPINVVLKVKYSRRSDKNIDCYKVIKSSGDAIDDVDGTVFGTNTNWELLAPRGFRFYMPGSVGPGWLDSSTTGSSNVLPYDDLSDDEIVMNALTLEYKGPSVSCLAQRCPILLRKGILELFPDASSSLDPNSTNFTIVTISQRSSKNNRRWSQVEETEKLTKNFVLVASEFCRKMKLIGFWADFINPFSGMPYFSTIKNNTLYQTDKRFRCLGFKIEQRNNCKVISCDGKSRDFVGSLYTTAPTTSEFLKDIVSETNEH